MGRYLAPSGENRETEPYPLRRVWRFGIDVSKARSAVARAGGALDGAELVLVERGVVCQINQLRVLRDRRLRQQGEGDDDTCDRGA